MTATRPPHPAWRKPLTISFSLVVTLGLGIIDFLTGREIVVSPFYLLPICWVTWVYGRTSGLLVSVASAVVWLVADMAEMLEYPHRAIPYWNALMLLIVFVVVVYLLTAFHDVHQRLEEKVEERTASLRREIAERQRLEAGKIRAERLAMVGTMAAEVAHEVRNPLGSIALNLDLIEKEIQALAKTSRHEMVESSVLVGEMRSEVQRIRKVLEDYLQFARISKAQHRQVVLNDLLEQKLAFLGGDLIQAKVTLHTEFDPELTSIHADAEQIWQAVLNLVRNALEAMPGGGNLTVRTRRGDSRAILQVSDSGKGMGTEEQARIFEPFFSTKAKGTGLGLSLVQQIISEHRGHLECASDLGKGSTFTLFLPLDEKAKR